MGISECVQFLELDTVVKELLVVGHEKRLRYVAFLLFFSLIVFYSCKLLQHFSSVSSPCASRFLNVILIAVLHLFLIRFNDILSRRRANDLQVL